MDYAETRKVNEPAGEDSAAWGQVTSTFHAFVQPKIHLATGVVAGHEVLVRPVHHQGGVEAYYKRLSREPLPIRLGRELEILRVAGSVRSCSGPISVNVSFPLLESTAGLHLLESLLADREPGQMTIELLEGDEANVSTAIPAIARLADRGARIALDDFGKGHSTLALVGALPVLHEIKFDRSLVHSPKARELLESLVDLAMRMNVETTVAEWVDSARLDELVRACGVTCGQGYFYGAPSPA